MKPPLIIIAGPTACGKTETAVKLAQKINGEIVSADSMQIYKFMDIGTAKPSKEEMGGINHYMINELYPNEEFSVAIFKVMAQNYVTQIINKGKIPILTGGTGFYINALLHNNNFMETNTDLTYRNSLYKLAEENGNEYLHSILKNVDAESADTIHPNNLKRVIRALEYFNQTGEKISTHNAIEKNKEPYYNASFFILNMDRQLLYDRINLRVDKMIENGLINEVEGLLEKGYSENLVSMKGLGYKEIIKYLKGEYSLEEAVFILKRDTRHFAKRQLTWFTHQSQGFWINNNTKDLNNAIIDIMINKLKETNLLK